MTNEKILDYFDFINNKKEFLSSTQQRPRYVSGGVSHSNSGSAAHLLVKKYPGGSLLRGSVQTA
jgi:hypothetical protein